MERGILGGSAQTRLMSQNILNIENLSVSFKSETHIVNVINDVSFSIDSGDLFALVGESGSGKSITSLTVMDLLPVNFFVKTGTILWNGENLLDMPSEKRRKLKGDQIGMVFQEPLTALNPLMTIGMQIAENIILHKKKSKKEALDIAALLLNKVDIKGGKDRLDNYPHELSGGMRQRVMIAMAIACNPSLLIADEPTTALDVTVQAGVMKLIKDLCLSQNMALLLVSHNLALVKSYCKKTLVMYGGMILECGNSGQIFTNPKHPYTKGLISCLPSLNSSKKIISITGQPPSLYNRPDGCLFHPRCSEKTEICETTIPKVNVIDSENWVRCHLYN